MNHTEPLFFRCACVRVTYAESSLLKLGVARVRAGLHAEQNGTRKARTRRVSVNRGDQTVRRCAAHRRRLAANGRIRKIDTEHQPCADDSTINGSCRPGRTFVPIKQPFVACRTAVLWNEH